MLTGRYLERYGLKLPSESSRACQEMMHPRAICLYKVSFPAWSGNPFQYQLNSKDSMESLSKRNGTR